ncbi:MAG: helix-turn-helix domain-containing protein [Bifidobacteriaceae bacterium]|nr:helix-turn-helix domain-containing protein [Bifidobacteriaceae bacterium]
MLRALSGFPNSTPELMALTGLTRPSIGRLLRGLEVEGLVAPTTEHRRSPNVKSAAT